LIGKYKLNLTNVAYPDDLSIANAKKDTLRNGSIGGDFLRRFHVIFDYSSSKIYFKRNRQYKKKFNNNLSGMEVVYDGKELVENWELDYGYDSSLSSGNTELLQIEKLLNYSFKPNYKVHAILKGSPAYIAGLRVGDQLLKIGNKSCFDLKLEDINGYFLKPKKKLKITYLRNFEEFQTTLKLVDIYPN
jgi:membrane-associated protease RseP (regulator of RpoE activity)